jgi:predicted GIY-YIG superfamily endonuclease
MHERSYFTYIMASRSRNLYFGVTGDLLRRVFHHHVHESAFAIPDVSLAMRK